jgi:hypothetical protein
VIRARSARASRRRSCATWWRPRVADQGRAQAHRRRVRRRRAAAARGDAAPHRGGLPGRRHDAQPRAARDRRPAALPLPGGRHLAGRRHRLPARARPHGPAEQRARACASPT